MPRLNILDHVPESFLNLPATELWRVLPGPTLIHLGGRRPEPLFVSLLLHGNEDVGLIAMQRLLTGLQGKILPRALSIFVGNISAARAGVRRLADQPDYNRVWPSSEGAISDESRSAEQILMQQVVAEMRPRHVFASVDLHNNTGKNPFYACINRLDFPFLHLASFFSRTVVFFRSPAGVQSMAFSEFCPAVTCECGKVGDPAGIAHAADFLEACLNLSEIPAHAVSPNDVHLFHTVATVKVPCDVSFGFDSTDTDLSFSSELEEMNFRELEPGTRLATRRPNSQSNLIVFNDANVDVTTQYLMETPDEICLRRPVMPSMLTHNEQVIRQDCLGYFMERLPLPAG